MLKQFVSGRVYVFIDGANIFYAQRSLKWKISYEKLIKYIKKDCGKETKCFVYIATIPESAKQKRFLDLLDIIGYIVRTKPIKIIETAPGQRIWKGNLDIELALEMYETNDSYDTAILISGDSDFAPVIDRLKQKSKKIIVMSTKEHISKELIERAKFVDFRKLKEILKLKYK